MATNDDWDRKQKRQTKRKMSNRDSGRYDPPRQKVRPVGADGFYSDEPEWRPENRKKADTVYDRSTGQHKKKTAVKMDTKKWWGDKLKGGAPASVRKRKQKIDKEVAKAGG